MQGEADHWEESTRRMIAAYDEEAEATGWRGPEVLFGLAYVYVQAGQSMLDIGIGTGLSSAPFVRAGLHVHGMDIAPEMLAGCRSKGITELKQHDLQQAPYPYDSESMELVICAGVLHFFADLSLIFSEAARILRPEGVFGCVVGDRSGDEAGEFVVGPEHTHADYSLTMYRHSTSQIDAWAHRVGLHTVRSLMFETYMDREKQHVLRAKAYLMAKAKG